MKILIQKSQSDLKMVNIMFISCKSYKARKLPILIEDDKVGSKMKNLARNWQNWLENDVFGSKLKDLARK